MSDELAVIPAGAFDRSDKGSYMITKEQLAKHSMAFYELFADAFAKLVMSNPDFNFEVEDDILTGGIRITWEKNVNSTNAASSSEAAVRPELDS